MQGKIGQVKKRREGGGLQVREAPFKYKKKRWLVTFLRFYLFLGLL
jgi:hypothetical protein